MGVLEKIAAAQGAKSFSQPNFWDLSAGPIWSSSSSEFERIENDFESYVAGAYKGSSPVFSAIDRRQQVFSQVRFLWQKFAGGRPGDLFGDPGLGLLETPWPNGTIGELLARMEVDASISGTFFATTVDTAGGIGRKATGPGKYISRLRPDWVWIVLGAPSGNFWAADTRIIAYEYRPPGTGGVVGDPLLLMPDEVVHYSPKPDPIARFRGMSWMTPVLLEIMGDRAATAHKLKFFQNGATPNFALKFPPGTTPERLKEYQKLFDAQHKGTEKAYKTLFLAGADPVPLAANFAQMDFKVTQGAGETRIAAASGVPAAILGISEGLAGSALNAGNFGAARRLFVDTTVRDLWAKAAPSLQTILAKPTGAVRLWYDDRDIPFLREDAKDDAAIRGLDAGTIEALVRAGYDPDAAVEFVRTGDFSQLKGNHTGLFSVQLQSPGQNAIIPAKGGTV
jgi:hypothetical protein